MDKTSVTELKSILQAAHQGNTEAITSLLNQAFSRFGINALVRRDQGGLQIMLEGEQPPEQKIYTLLVARGLARLQIASLDQVRVHGRLRGQDWPVWTRHIKLVLPTEPEVFTPLVHELETDELPAPVVPPFVSISDSPPPPQPISQFVDSPSVEVTSASKAWSWGQGLGGVGVILGLLLGAWGMNRWHQEAMAQSTEPSTINPSFSPSVDPEPSPTGTPAPSPSLSPSPTPPPAATSLMIKAVGDMIPGTNFPDYRLPDKQPQILFAQVQPLLAGADVLFGNYESTLTTYPYTPKNVSSGRSFAFRTPPVYAAIIRRAGFDILSVANNHSFDFGLQGFQDTIRHIEAAGMAAIGRKGQIYYRNIKGIRTAWIGFSTYPDHNSILDLKAAQVLIRKARQNATVVVVSFHGGAEGTDQTRTPNRTEIFYGENRGNLVNFARRVIEAGADLVLGHGPHVPRALELYQNRLVAYSLGNFLGYETLSTNGVAGDSLVLQVEVDPQGKFLQGQILPVRLNGQGIPVSAPQGNTIPLIRQLTRLDFPNTPLQISATGKITPRSRPQTAPPAPKPMPQSTLKSTPKLSPSPSPAASPTPF